MLNKNTSSLILKKLMCAENNFIQTIMSLTCSIANFWKYYEICYKDFGSFFTSTVLILINLLEP